MSHTVIACVVAAWVLASPIAAIVLGHLTTPREWRRRR